MATADRQQPRRVRFASANVRWPRVFIYNTSHALLLERFLHERSPSEQRAWAFGRHLGEGYHGTDTWAIASILAYRLLRQRPELRTTDPEAADLFLIPMLPRRPSYGTSDRYEADFQNETRDSCDTLWSRELPRTYPHLTLESASRHMILAIDYTPILAFCAIRPDMRFAGRPPAHANLLRRMKWLLNEELGTPADVDPSPHAFYGRMPVLPGGGLLVNVPFPSAVHSRAALLRHANPLRPRRTLLSFAGSLKGSPTGKALRARIDAQCRKHGAPACRLHSFAPGADLSGGTIVGAYRLKSSSTFCAEPGGHNLIRKGVVDALLNGCIPVVFLRDDEFRRLWPHHLFGWRDEAMLNIPPATMLDGAGLDLVEHLKAIPPERIARMRRAIAMHGQRIAYLDERVLGPTEDAADILLKGAAFGLPGR